MNFICNNALYFAPRENNIIAEPGSTLKFKLSIEYLKSFLLKSCNLKYVFPKGVSLLTDTLESSYKATCTANTLEVDLLGLQAEESADISFDVLIDENLPIDELNTTLSCMYTLNYSYVNSKGDVISNTEESPILNLCISDLKLDLSIKPSLDICNAGELISYVIKGENSNSIPISDIKILPILCDELRYFPNSIELVTPDSKIPTIIDEDLIKEGLTLNTPEFKLKFLALTSKDCPLNSSLFSKVILLSSVTLNNINYTLLKEYKSADTKIQNKSCVMLKKEVTPNTATIGDIVNYTVTIENNSDLALNYVFLKDELNINLCFTPASVKINGEEKPFEDVNHGINLGHILPHDSYIVTFTAKVISLPSSRFISNTASLSHEYTLDPSKPPIKETLQSNPVSIVAELGQLVVSKSCSKTSIDLYDTFSYSITLTNTGNLDCKDVVLQDSLSQYFKFINTSLKVNQEVLPIENLKKGISLGIIKPDKEVSVTFDVIYFKPCYSSLIEDTCFTTFKCDSTKSHIEMKTEEILTTLYPSNYIYESFCIDNINLLPNAPQGVNEIIDFTTETEISRYYVVKTSEVYFNNDEIYNVYKLMIHGFIKLNVQYTVNQDSQNTVYNQHIKIPFSKFLDLPEGCTSKNKILVDLIIDDVYYKLLNKNYICSNIMLLAKAKLSRK
ncbi:conserved repeat domain-containing protein/fimbrial isopeptide formation D2 domain-containing protein [Clostridium collagenovorans DSM 3089]|uniref:Conserved repeat domain-containing protein/fimbrial isopeptide formation D2 domain-containing protein n=1 Tax=Clostridium collagenovorans DSM 3089 TaxID=1121306 RepID=A0A1M5WPI3_9CLOT|nr:SPOCS domain-containing protein [Clostridium collagenovorans]SHH89044.1 conserved repeat domain-containing protein/fimbrial isopeptide formation D2 domain-containing protein [Clostridium collagenovorans DSM 3089]